MQEPRKGNKVESAVGYRHSASVSKESRRVGGNSSQKSANYKEIKQFLQFKGHCENRMMRELLHW